MAVLKKPVKIRKLWGINPRTRVKKSKKAYSRQELKLDTKRIIENEK